jgi:hypothetical protein
MFGARRIAVTVVWLVTGFAGASHAQVAPSATERAAYTGLLAAAARGDAAEIRALAARGQRPDVRDAHGRTPLHVAAYNRHHDAMRALVALGADPNALENDRYDIVTIAAVANDVTTLKVALALGARRRSAPGPRQQSRLDRGHRVDRPG